MEHTVTSRDQGWKVAERWTYFLIKTVYFKLLVNLWFCDVDAPVWTVDDDESSLHKLLYEHIWGILNGLEMFDRSWIQEELDIGMVQFLS